MSSSGALNTHFLILAAAAVSSKLEDLGLMSAAAVRILMWEIQTWRKITCKHT